MKYITKPLWLILLVSSFLVACSESAENFPGTKDGPNSGEVVRPGDVRVDKSGGFQIDDFKISPELATLIFGRPGESSGFGSVEVEKLKLENLEKPMIYGQGAAGITIDTTFEESKTLLTPPDLGPFADGATLYNEQLIVVWNLQGSGKPFIIYVTKGYKGTLAAGKFGQIGMQTKFLSYKADGEEGAQRLIQELHREFEEVEDENYNCLTQTEFKRCQLYYGDENQANLLMVFPGMQILVAKEEFQVAEMRFLRNSDPGLLANNIDLMTGDILVPGQDSFKLGQTKKEIFDRLIADQGKIDPEVFIDTDAFVYSWEGVYLVMNRTNYVNTAKQAEDSDINKVVQVTSTFPAYLTVGGQRILMDQTVDDVSFSLEVTKDPVTGDMDDVNVSADRIQSKMKMTTTVFDQNSLVFSTKFAEFLKAELEKSYDVVQFRSFGYQNKAKLENDSATISTTIRAYNRADYNGVGIGYRVSQRQQKLDFVNTFTLDSKFNAFNKLTYPASSNNVVRVDGEVTELNFNGDPVIDPATGEEKKIIAKLPTFTTLGGMKMNDLVRLTEIDALGRGEATIEYLSGTEEIKERGGYTEEGTLDVPDGLRPVPRDQSFVSVGSSGTVLGIKAIGSDDKGLLARVVSIGSNNIYGKIQDVCGLGQNIGFTIGMTDVEAEAMLADAIDAQQAIDKNFECKHFKVSDDGALGLLKEIYFPDEQIKLVFSNRALGAAEIYMDINAIDTTLPEAK